MDRVEPADEFLRRSRASLKELTEQAKALLAQEEGVRRRREAVEDEARRLTNAISVYREVMGVRSEAVPARALFDDVLTAGSIAEMAGEVIERMGGRAKIADIVDILTRSGKLRPEESPTSRSRYATVYSILNRNPRFHRIGEGEFALVPPDGAKDQSSLSRRET